MSDMVVDSSNSASLGSNLLPSFLSAELPVGDDGASLFAQLMSSFSSLPSDKDQQLLSFFNAQLKAQPELLTNLMKDTNLGAQTSLEQPSVIDAMALLPELQNLPELSLSQNVTDAPLPISAFLFKKKSVDSNSEQARLQDDAQLLLANASMPIVEQHTAINLLPLAAATTPDLLATTNSLEIEQPFLDNSLSLETPDSNSQSTMVGLLTQENSQDNNQDKKINSSYFANQWQLLPDQVNRVSDQSIQLTSVSSPLIIKDQLEDNRLVKAMDVLSQVKTGFSPIETLQAQQLVNREDLTKNVETLITNEENLIKNISLQPDQGLTINQAVSKEITNDSQTFSFVKDKQDKGTLLADAGISKVMQLNAKHPLEESVQLPSPSLIKADAPLDAKKDLLEKITGIEDKTVNLSEYVTTQMKSLNIQSVTVTQSSGLPTSLVSSNDNGLAPQLLMPSPVAKSEDPVLNKEGQQLTIISDSSFPEALEELLSLESTDAIKFDSADEVHQSAILTNAQSVKISNEGFNQTNISASAGLTSATLNQQQQQGMNDRQQSNQQQLDKIVNNNIELSQTKEAETNSFNELLTGFQNSVSSSLGARADWLSSPISFKQPQWTQDVSHRLGQMVNAKVDEISIRLDPEELGPIQVKLLMSDETTAQVSMVAQHGLTRDMLENALPRLKDLLAQQGIELANATVSAGTDHNQAGNNGEEQRKSMFAQNNHSENGGEVDKANSTITESVRVVTNKVDHYA